MTTVQSQAEAGHAAASRIDAAATLLGESGVDATDPAALAVAMGPIGAVFTAAFLAAANRHAEATGALATRLGTAARHTVHAHQSYDEGERSTMTALRGAWT